jgi:hypothetical protein
MNWNGCGRIWSLPNIRYCHSICLEGLTNTIKNISQDSWSLGPHLNMGVENIKQVCNPLNHKVQSVNHVNHDSHKNRTSSKVSISSVVSSHKHFSYIYARFSPFTLYICPHLVYLYSCDNGCSFIFFSLCP